jgi:hypothetical protein
LSGWLGSPTMEYTQRARKVAGESPHYFKASNL